MLSAECWVAGADLSYPHAPAVVARLCPQTLTLPSPAAEGDGASAREAVPGELAAAGGRWKGAVARPMGFIWSSTLERPKTNVCRWLITVLRV